MAKSYYSILGITSDATDEEVKSAYRRLSKEFHPDHYKGTSEAFLEIQEAYSVLSDVGKRHEYERQRTQAAVNVKSHAYPEPEPLISKETAEPLGDISPIRSFETFSPSFDKIFDWLWRNFSNFNPIKSGRIQNLTLEIPLTAVQALRGGSARVLVPVMSVCPHCQGAGNVGYYHCIRCGGEGSISEEMPVMVSFPGRLTKRHAVEIPLERFGIRNLFMTVIFYPTDSDDI